jgi:putative membrane protein
MDPALYPWIKSLHIIAVIAWMAGMLYLPRLFVYHCEAGPGSVQSETFKVMERRLLRAIINPAMIATWALGLARMGCGFSGRLASRQTRTGGDPLGVHGFRAMRA